MVINKRNTTINSNALRLAKKAFSSINLQQGLHDLPASTIEFGRVLRQVGKSAFTRKPQAWGKYDPGSLYGQIQSAPQTPAGQREIAKDIAIQFMAGARDIPMPEKIPSFIGFSDLSTNILKRLRGKTVVNKQYIQDLTNMPELKQPERNLIRRVLGKTPEQRIKVKEFAKGVKQKLLPLTTHSRSRATPEEIIGDAFGEGFTEVTKIYPRYEYISLPEELRGPVRDYAEHVYQSPVKTSAGDIHFDREAFPNYFAHVRTEDIPDLAKKNLWKKTSNTRRIIELQSDLFQKGGLRRGIEGVAQEQTKRLPFDPYKTFETNLAQLRPYRNTWYERIIKEEIKRAAQDGKTKLQFPTGETAMKIEGLGEAEQFQLLTPSTRGEGGVVRGFLKPEDLRVGQHVVSGQVHGANNDWIITDVLGDGKFKAVPKNVWDATKPNALKIIKDTTTGGDKIYLVQNTQTGEVLKPSGEKTLQRAKEFINSWRKQKIEDLKETFDISGKMDKNNPIYKFYEKQVQRFLKRIRPDLKRITDPQGVTWFETNIKKKDLVEPVTAFGVAGTLGLNVLGNKKNKN